MRQQGIGSGEIRERVHCAVAITTDLLAHKSELPWLHQ